MEHKMNALSIDVEQLADLPQALFKLAAAAKANAQFVRLADKTIREEFELFDWLERRSIEPTFDFEYHHIKVQFTGDGPLLADFWRLLRQAGYNTDSRICGQKCEHEYWCSETRHWHAEGECHAIGRCAPAAS
jgi:hypothetical protein